MPTLDDLKKYLRIDGSEDDSLLTLLMDAAREYLLNSGVPDGAGSLYQLAIMRHVSLQYENRAADIPEDKSLISMIWQLKSYPPTI